MKNRPFKKVLSVFLAVLMIMSAWVWVAPEHNHASAVAASEVAKTNEDALKTVMQNGGASTSYLQRRLAIGYSRAAKIIDQMTDKGYIAQANGSKQRKILITPDEFREQFGEEYDS